MTRKTTENFDPSWFRRLRKEHGFSQDDVAKGLEISRKTINLLETIGGHRMYALALVAMIEHPEFLEKKPAEWVLNLPDDGEET